MTLTLCYFVTLTLLSCDTNTLLFCDIDILLFWKTNTLLLCDTDILPFCDTNTLLFSNTHCYFVVYPGHNCHDWWQWHQPCDTTTWHITGDPGQLWWPEQRQMVEGVPTTYPWPRYITARVLIPSLTLSYLLCCSCAELIEQTLNKNFVFDLNKSYILFLYKKTVLEFSSFLLHLFSFFFPNILYCIYVNDTLFCVATYQLEICAT